MIKKLPDSIISRISAGEVITSPYNVIKELIENSIDAGSTHISLDLNSSLLSLTISDNGSGIERTDFQSLCLNHHTSKINSLLDLKEIGTISSLFTFGFRGEALHSISLCSHVTVVSMRDDVAHKGTYNGCDLIDIKETARNTNGTDVIVDDIFFNNILRRDHFYKNKSECMNCIELMKSYGCVYSGIEMRVDNKYVIERDNAPRNLADAIKSIKQQELSLNSITKENNSIECDSGAKSCLVTQEYSLSSSITEKRQSVKEDSIHPKIEEIERPEHNISNEKSRIYNSILENPGNNLDQIIKNKLNIIFKYFIVSETKNSKKEDILFEISKDFFVAFTNKRISMKKYRFILFINNRLVRNISLKNRILQKYKSLLKDGKCPFVFIEIFLDYVDANVHPSKAEVLVGDESIFDRICKKIEARLTESDSAFVPGTSQSSMRGVLNNSGNDDVDISLSPYDSSCKMSSFNYSKETRSSLDLKGDKNIKSDNEENSETSISQANANSKSSNEINKIFEARSKPIKISSNGLSSIYTTQAYSDDPKPSNGSNSFKSLVSRLNNKTISNTKSGSINFNTNNQDLIKRSKIAINDNNPELIKIPKIDIKDNLEFMDHNIDKSDDIENSLINNDKNHYRVKSDDIEESVINNHKNHNIDKSDDIETLLINNDKNHNMVKSDVIENSLIDNDKSMILTENKINLDYLPSDHLSEVDESKIINNEDISRLGELPIKHVDTQSLDIINVLDDKTYGFSSPFMNNGTNHINSSTILSQISDGYDFKLYSDPGNRSLDECLRTPTKPCRKYSLVSLRNLRNEIVEKDSGFFRSMVYVGSTEDYIFAQSYMNLIKIERREFLRNYFYSAVIKNFGNIESREIEPVRTEIESSMHGILDEYFGIKIKDGSIVGVPVFHDAIARDWSGFFVTKGEECETIKNVASEISKIYSNIELNNKIFNLIKSQVIGTEEIINSCTIVIELKDLYKKFGRC